MTTDEVKTVLGEVRNAYRRYLLAREKAARFRDGFLSPPAVSDMPHSSSRSNGTENRLVSLIGCDEEAAECLEKYLEARRAAESLIGSLENPDEKEVLTRRYIMFEKWEDIAEKMNYSKQHIFRIRNRALKKMRVNESKCD